MPFASIGNPGCCCGGPPPVCKANITMPVVCGGSLPASWSVKNLSTGAVVGTGTAAGSVNLTTDNFELTATYSAAGFCAGTVLSTPQVIDFSMTCPGTIGVPLSTSILSFSRTVNFTPVPTPAHDCGTGPNGCTIIEGDLTIDSTSYANALNAGKAGSAFFPPVPLFIEGLQPSVPMTIDFHLDLVWTNINPFTCSIKGQVCYTYHGSTTITIDPCTENACTFPTTVNVPMS